MFYLFTLKVGSKCTWIILTSSSVKPTIVTLGNFPCNLSRNLVTPLQQKLHESLRSVTYPEMNMSSNVSVAVTVARSRTDFYFSQRLRQQKNLRDMFILGHVTLGNGSCNLCRNKIARQIARKIAQCNSALCNQGNVFIAQLLWQCPRYGKNRALAMECSQLASGTRLFGSSQWIISWRTEAFEKAVLFSQLRRPKWRY